jgi:5S rRNA maturation endonuclease (ribonuclease M5)
MNNNNNNNNSTSIKQYLESKNIYPTKKFRNYGMYLSPLRKEKTPSFKVDYIKNLWFDFGLNQGGNYIQLLKKLQAENIKYPIEKQTQFKSNKKKFQIFDVRDLKNSRLIDYLKSRKIDLNSIKNVFNEVYYGETESKLYYSLGFMNQDGGWELRNKNFKGSIGKKSITSFYYNSSTLILFEGMFDFFSFLVMYPNKNTYNYIILNSTNNLHKSLKYLNDHKKVIVFFDNDHSGKFAAQIVKKNTKKEFIDMSNSYKNYNDLNQYLMKHKP